MKKKQAFSLIELAIAVIVIGLMIVGVVGGSGMIKSARINSARSFTAKSVVPSINGLVAWWETSLKNSLKESEAYNGAQISTWYDISPASTVGAISNRKNILTKTASSGIIYVNDGINNTPSLQFSGSGTNSSADSGGKISLTDFYQGSATQNTIFIVARPSALASTFSRTIIDSGHTDIDGSNAASASMASSNSLEINLGSAVTTSTATNAANFVNGQDFILALYFNQSDSKAFLNDAATAIGNSTINPGSQILQGFTIGSNRNSYQSFNGLISEVIVYNHALQLQERRDVFKYLSHKYNIQVTGI